jgi:hypothetical protein
MRIAASIGLALLLLVPSLAAAAPDCPAAPAGATERSYRNARFGFGLTVPPVFVLDPESVTEDGSSARFWTPDGRVTAVVNATPNTRRLALREIMAEAEGDVLHNAGGDITYRRIRDNWFVISGHMVGRIYYRRTLLTRAGVLATLWMEFPTELRPCLEEAVTTMSLSFRELPTPAPSR